MWTATCLPDPVFSNPRTSTTTAPSQSFLVQGKTPFGSLLAATDDADESKIMLASFREGERPARVALADFCARSVLDRFQRNWLSCGEANGLKLEWEPLDYAGSSRRSKALSNQTPYILERTDFWSTNEEVNIMLRCRVTPVSTTADMEEDEKKTNGGDNSGAMQTLEKATSEILGSLLGPQSPDFAMEAMRHIACVVAQNRLRECVAKMNSVAFIADGAILPRKSGANNAPMASPPAVPCKAPSDSALKQTLEVEMGALRKYLDAPTDDSQSTIFSITGMVIPKGITLIAGGGYHGKSTLLRAVAAGVFDKAPGDGRELCVTVPDAISIRAEDGRYVNNCNISAFISNLPTLPGVEQSIDTTHFSSGEASGSTSQAANVAEAIEMGAKLFLVDEDVSAANFMARDGRMRALVMDESITPLLYRVNGMYKQLGISCVVVVGGVGDWLDVPDQVILMNKYVASDATKKARSISYQFSYGHVQYAGKGVVHQLEWDKQGSPLQRRPTEEFLNLFEPDTSTISLLDGGHAISIHPSDSTDEDVAMAGVDSTYDDDDDGYIDLSRCEQLLGKKPQLYGCGQCVIWILRRAKQHRGIGIMAHLHILDRFIDNNGMLKIFADNAAADALPMSPAWKHLLHSSGFAYRPRKYEIGQAFTRMRGIQLEHIPVEDDGEEERIAREAERRKQELAKLWASRRPKNV